MDPVSLQLDGEVARVEFGDPATRNLLTVPVLEGLPRALAEAEVRGARVIVLRGRGDVWSGGYDIGEIPPTLFDADPEIVRQHPFERCMRAVEECVVPTIAAINGHALGGGLELAASCDLRLVCDGARLGIPAARLGIVYSQTGLAKFVRLVGPAHTRMMFFTGRRIDAAEAARIGLVNAVVPADDFDRAVTLLAQDIAASAPFAVQSMKRLLRLTERGGPLSAAEEVEVHALRRQAFHSDDFNEGRAAFQAKRAPRFTGR